MIAISLWLAALALFVWSYVGYPLWLLRRAKKEGVEPFPDPERWPSVEVLVAAADEAAVIERRIQNLLAQDCPAERLTIAVGCDGCRDDTAELARRAGRERVRILEFPGRRGKAATLNDLAASSSAEVLVFTDANTEFAPDAVRQLVRTLARPGVGAACGRLVLVDPAPPRSRAAGDGRQATEPGATGNSVESLYWERESALKEAEGRLGLCLGANGAIYAAWRERVQPLPQEMSAMDDFLLAASIVRDGSDAVFAPAAVAREEISGRLSEELRRRWRLGIGAGQVMRRLRWLWTGGGRKGLASIFFGRKASRWLAPIFAMAGVGAALFDPTLRAAGVAAGLTAAALLLSVPLVRRIPRATLPGTIYYFLVTNLVLGTGVVAGLAGARRAIWRRTQR